MYMSYDLSHYLDGDISRSTSFTVSDDDAINCAHMLAAGFNTISRKMMGDFVLAVVDTKAGTVQYDGKIEKIDRPDPHTVSASFKFEASTDPDTMVTIFDNENGRLMFPGKLKFAETDETTSATAAEIIAPMMNQKVLEDAYVELHRVKDALFDAGVETIPADRGVKDLSHVIRARDAEIAEFVQERANRAAEQAKYESDEYMPLRWESFAKIDDALRDNDVTNKRLDEGVRELGRRLEHEFHARTMLEQQYAQANESARAELIHHVKGAYGKYCRVDPGRNRGDLKSHLNGMIEVLSKFLVVTGEADEDERHAVAKRLCDIPEGTYLYGEA